HGGRFPGGIAADPFGQRVLQDFGGCGGVGGGCAIGVLRHFVFAARGVRISRGSTESRRGGAGDRAATRTRNGGTAFREAALRGTHGRDHRFSRGLFDCRQRGGLEVQARADRRLSAVVREFKNRF